MRAKPVLSALALSLITTGGVTAAAQAATAAQIGSLATSAIAAAPAQLKTAPGDQFAAEQTLTDPNGASHVRYTRTHDGLPVRGGDFVVHLRPDGSAEAPSVAQTAPITVGTTPAKSAASAQATARAKFSGVVQSVAAPKLEIDAVAGTPALAFETVVKGIAPGGGPSELHVITDATTGAIRDSYDEVRTATGTGNSIWSGKVSLTTSPNPTFGYLLYDAARSYYSVCDLANTAQASCPAIAADADNVWGNGTQSDRNSANVDAAYGLYKTYDMYKTYFGRSGVYADGTAVQAFSHFGNGVANAFYTDGLLILGDGVGNARPVDEIDVMGHELSHGVTEQTAGLNYSGESGGLNEGTSDIFGTATEFYANNAVDTPDYTIGERININGNGLPLRWMYKPSLDGKSPDCYSSAVAGLDVHYSSGIANKFFYMLAEGSTSPYGTAPTCGAPAVTGIGRVNAAKLWYKALTTYMTSTTAYQAPGTNDARAATLSAAKDLYGLCSTQYQAVQAAWNASAVAGEDLPCHGTFTNGTDVAIPDPVALAVSRVTSNIPGLVGGTLKVSVDIKHARRGDLILDLISPSGTSYRLKNSDLSDAAANVITTYTVNAAGQTAAGAWTLRAIDNRQAITGYINSWSLTF